MTIEDFIDEFVNVFDDTDRGDLHPETNFRELDEWSSLHALATISMLKQTYGKEVSAEVMKKQTTIQDLFNLVNE